MVFLRKNPATTGSGHCWRQDCRITLRLRQSISGPTGLCPCRQRIIAQQSSRCLTLTLTAQKRIMLHANYITVIYMPWLPKVVTAWGKDFFFLLCIIKPAHSSQLLVKPLLLISTNAGISSAALQGEALFLSSYLHLNKDEDIHRPQMQFSAALTFYIQRVKYLKYS